MAGAQLLERKGDKSDTTQKHHIAKHEEERRTALATYQCHRNMAVSKVESFEGRFEIRTASSDTVSIGADGTLDIDIPFSAFGATGKPLALAGYTYTGNGFSFLMIYKMVIDTANSKISFSVRNNRSTAASVKLNVSVLFV